MIYFILIKRTYSISTINIQQHCSVSRERGCVQVFLSVCVEKRPLVGFSSGIRTRPGWPTVLVRSNVFQRSVLWLLYHFQTQIRLQGLRNTHGSILKTYSHQVSYLKTEDGGNDLHA